MVSFHAGTGINKKREALLPSKRFSPIFPTFAQETAKQVKLCPVPRSKLRIICGVSDRRKTTCGGKMTKK
jgi:hypothetical protein